LAFSYWINNLGFITERKLAAIFIKPSLGVSNWPIILLHLQTQSSFLASSSPHHHERSLHVEPGLDGIFCQVVDPLPRCAGQHQGQIVDSNIG
jgi:hypothetical protein